MADDGEIGICEFRFEANIEGGDRNIEKIHH